MDYTPNIDAQGMRRPMGPVDQPNWNGGPKLIHNPQVMNNQTVGQPNLANAMANQRPIIPIRGRIVTSEQDIVPAEIPMDGSICLFMTEDCKKVIAKQWNSNGVLQSIIYSISSNEQAQSECQNGDNTGELKAQLDRIENMLKRQGHQNKSRFKEDKKNDKSMYSANAIQAQLADCCCQNRQGQAQIQYDMATNTCAITNAISNQTRDIIDNDNANYRALHDEMVKMQMDAKDQTIASQQAAINKLELTASQCAQNQYLVNQLRPAAVPAFTVPNPYANYGFGCYCGSSNNGCC